MRFTKIIRTLAGAGMIVGCSSSNISGTIPQGVVATMESAASVTIGDSLKLTLRVMNTSDRATSLWLAMSGDQAFDPVVTNAAGVEVWNRFGGKAVAGTVQSLSLAAHSERVFETTWNLRDGNGVPIPPGQYLVSGRLLLDDGTTLMAQNSPASLGVLVHQ